MKDLIARSGELICPIWGMDLRPRMYAIHVGQKSVTDTDALADYVPTSHVGVEIGQPVGLHYHYGTLGQLQHGLNYAAAYLRTIDKAPIMPKDSATFDWIIVMINIVVIVSNAKL